MAAAIMDSFKNPQSGLENLHNISRNPRKLSVEETLMIVNERANSVTGIMSKQKYKKKLNHSLKNTIDCAKIHRFIYFIYSIHTYIHFLQLDVKAMTFDYYLNYFDITLPICSPDNLQPGTVRHHSEISTAQKRHRMANKGRIKGFMKNTIIY